jgi:ribonuclease HI
MSANIRIWVEISHQPAFRAGGWAYVLAEGGARLGAAGGERSAVDERIALAGLVEALKATPQGASVDVHSASPAVSALPKRLATADADPPSGDLDLWAALSTALASRQVRFAPTANQPRTPTAFAVAWAELARDKAKTKPFRAVIPKTNLEKAFVPAER